MLNALGKLLPSVKEDGLVLPKLVQAFTVYNASERLKHKEHRRPFSAPTPIAFITKECIGETIAMQNMARHALLLHTRKLKQQMYEWSISFEIPMCTLVQSGYTITSDDDKTLYKDTFSA